MHAAVTASRKVSDLPISRDSAAPQVQPQSSTSGGRVSPSLTPNQKHAASTLASAATNRTAFHSFHVCSTQPNPIGDTTPPKLDAELMRPETAPASLPPISGC